MRSTSVILRLNKHFLPYIPIATLLPSVAFLFGLIFHAAPAVANEGVFLFGNDVQQLGRAGSGVASPRSAYWSYVNPASMVDIESRIDLSLYNVFPNVESKPRGLMGNRLDGTLKAGGMFNILSGGGIYNMERYGTIGGGLYIPSGTGVEYDHSRNILTRLFQGNKDRRLTYQHFRLVLSYAYEFPYGFALGASLHTSLSRFRSDHITLKFRPTEGDNEWDNALGIGYGVGVYKTWERFAIGASYISRHYTQKMHKYKDLLRYSLDTPQIIQVGVAWKVIPQVELTADYKFLNWKGIPTYGNKLLKGGFNWHDQWAVKLGIEWTIDEHWRVMAGYAHASTPIDKDHVFLSTLVPVTCEDHITTGFTYSYKEHHEFHFVFILGIPKTMKDTGRGDLLSHLGKGSELSSNGESFAIGYSYKF